MDAEALGCPPDSDLRWWPFMLTLGWTGGFLDPLGSERPDLGGPAVKLAKLCRDDLAEGADRLRVERLERQLARPDQGSTQVGQSVPVAARGASHPVPATTVLRTESPGLRSWSPDPSQCQRRRWSGP